MANDLKVKITADVKGFKSDIQDAGKSMDEFTDKTNDAGQSMADYQSKLSKSEMNIRSFNKELKQARKDALDLANAFNSLSPDQKMSGFGKQLKDQLDEAVKKTGELTDLKGDVQREINNIASDTRGFDTAKESIGLMMNTMGSLSSIIATVTGDQEAYNRAVTIFTGTQQTLNALTEIQNVLQKESNLYMLAEAANMKIVNALKNISIASTIKQTAATGAETAGQKAGTIATLAHAAAQKALNTAMKAGPYVIIAGAIAAIGGTIKLVTSLMDSYKKKVEDLNKAYDSSTKYTEEYKNITIQASRSAVEQTTKLKILYKVITDGNKSYKERANAIKEVKKIVPDYHASITKEGTLINNNISAINNYIKSLKKAIDAQVAYQSAVNKGLELNSSKFAEKALEDRITYLKQQLSTIDSRLSKVGEYEHKGGGYFEKKGGAASEGFFIKDSGQLQLYKAIREEMAAANKELSEQRNKTKTLAADYSKATDEAGKLAYEIEKTNKESNKTKTTNNKVEQIKYETLQLDELYKRRVKLNEEIEKYYKSGNSAKLQEADAELKKIDDVINKRKELNATYNLKFNPQLADVNKINTNPVSIPVEFDFTKLKAPDFAKLMKINELQSQLDSVIERFANAEFVTPEKIQEGQQEIDGLREKLIELYNSLPDELKKTIKIEVDKPGAKVATDTLDALQERIKTFVESTAGQGASIIGDFTQIAEMFANVKNETDGMVAGFAALSVAGDAIATIGEGLEQLGAGGAVAKAGAIAAAIGQIALSFAIASKQAAQVSAGWGWLVWMGAGLAALGTAVATISRFEQGGKVGGNSFHGDNILARLNSGERVLTKRQDDNLIKLLDSGKLSNANNVIVLDTKLVGTDIWLTQRNVDKNRKLAGKH